MKEIWLIVRGISGNPDDCQEWEQHAVDWILQDDWCQQRGFMARSDSYRCSLFNVFLKQKERAVSFGKVLKSYVDNGFTIHGLAHSNGTRVWREGWKYAGWPQVESLHFVCGACDSDFHRTGFNKALRTNRLGRFYYYTAGDDIAMKCENTILGRLDFAIPDHSCPLGLKGPRNVAPDIYDRVICGSRGWDRFGHSTCWLPHNFSDTLRRVVRAGY